MTRWAWSAFAIVGAVGAISAWYSYRLQTHHLPGLPEPDVHPTLIGISIVPTCLFWAASLLRRRSLWMQVSVAIAAVAVATLRIAVIRTELSAEWTHGTGLFSAMAWVVATIVAVIFAIVAGVAAVAEQFRRLDASPPAAA